MRQALTLHEGATGDLGSPTVGRWKAKLGLGAPVVPGEVLGWMVRLGKPFAVVAPRRASGAVVSLTPDDTWCAFGAVLLTTGEGGAVVAVGADEDRPTDAALEGATALRAETDGTVYLRPEPGAAPFAAEGATIAASATVALVEVMKTFTPVRSAAASVVVRVDVEDGQSVTAGEALLWVRGA